MEGIKKFFEGSGIAGKLMGGTAILLLLGICFGVSSIGDTYALTVDGYECPIGGTGPFESVAYDDYYCLLESVQKSSSSYDVGTSLKGNSTVCTNYLNEKNYKFVFSSVTGCAYAARELQKYTISYNANGGTGAPNDQIKTHGVSLTLSSMVPTRTGYTFVGWAGGNAHATSADYQPGATYASNTSVTFYAVWKVNTYTISYDANGGTGAPNDQIKTHGVSLTLSSTVPTRTGYNFAGWAGGNAHATSADYQPGATYASNTSVTFYAVWIASPETYTISYNANGGTGAPNDQIKTHGVSLTLSSTVPTRTGYTFVGWAGGNAHATSADYQPGAIYASNASVTFYAVWVAIPETYTISYNANGGTGAPSAQTKTHDISLNLSSTVPIRTGYTFLGWSASSTAASATWVAGGSYTKNGSITLYAVWKANTYTVTFNANSGSVSQTSKTVTYDSTYGELPTPTRAGYTFNGWYTALSGGSKITNMTKVTITAKQTLFAQWTANDNNADENEEVETTSYSVKYDANGGTGTMKDSTHVYGVASKLSANTFEREGYTFNGWNTKEDGTGDSYKDEDSVTDLSKENNGVVTLYAQWKADELPEEDNQDENDDKNDVTTGDNNNDNNNNNNNDDKKEEVTNPKTGSAGLILVGIISVGALAYLIYYYKKIKTN